MCLTCGTIGLANLVGLLVCEAQQGGWQPAEQLGVSLWISFFAVFSSLSFVLPHLLQSQSSSVSTVAFYPFVLSSAFALISSSFLHVQA